MDSRSLSQLRAQKAAAQAGFEATALDYVFARQSLAATTAKSWYIAIETRQLLVLAEEAVKILAENKPNVVFILADNVGYGDLGPYGAVSCAGRRRPASTNSPARDCGSRSTWSSQAARRRARR